MTSELSANHVWQDNETETDLLGFDVHADLIRSVVTDRSILPAYHETLQISLLPFSALLAIKRSMADQTVGRFG